ncbi:MAG: ABC transporter ATP-binding protein [Acidimicrobiales bacterium]|jgi:molybdate transport system ATP-binding protein|nr:ABC transporter ATP-binding protein [Acidimicrobiales bacterium]MDP6650152.1 ABC transporter ATP-binding protein [Acidimicrobiales bacterium]|tara:strand:+ start:1459 stop:2484 length:1026 start_codon:yes stop_codon:yes gene_type:complete
MSALSLAGMTRMGDLRLDVDLVVEPDETVAVLGPNGAGKTSLLRLLAGLLSLDSGALAIGGATVDEPGTGAFLPPHLRRVGWVPQDRLLFPHLTVAGNVGFGPGVDADRVAGLLDALGLTGLAYRRPDECSGGQAQRVALARALATDPVVLLLDEPSAALDVESRHLINGVLTAAEAPATLLVTHDPVEAATLADRLIVLENGAVSQAGSPREVRSRPKTRYVASLAGLNLLEATASGTVAVTALGTRVVLAEPAEGPVHLVVPPTAVALHRSAPDGSPRNVWQAGVTDLQPAFERIRVVLDGPLPVVAEVTPAAVEELGLRVGSEVWAAVKATEVACHAI